jgi:hypothetical protein
MGTTLRTFCARPASVNSQAKGEGSKRAASMLLTCSPIGRVLRIDATPRYGQRQLRKVLSA